MASIEPGSYIFLTLAGESDKQRQAEDFILLATY